jgi:RNA polymerase sigma-70 factor (ECF subfamily)
MPETDETLMARVVSGDAEAFTEIVRRYEAMARRYCYRIFRDTQTAEDAAQDMFLKLYRQADRYEPTGKFKTWFYRVLGNLCFDRLRFEKRRAAVRAGTMDSFAMDEEEDGDGRFPDPGAALVSQEQRAAVQAALRELSEATRQAVMLREFEGLKYREIAEAMEVGISDVKVLLHRGRKQLAKRLSRWIVEDGHDVRRP